MRYVALLRGVNVGGNNRVPRLEFQSVLGGLGFYDVTIYLNSGNAVFTSDNTVEPGVVQLALETHFGFAIPTLVIPGSKMQSIAAAIPAEWTNDTPRPDKSGQKSDVLYLFDDINTPDILNKIGYKPDIETMIYVDGAVIANISRSNQLRGSLQKLIGTHPYSRMTVRNVNTARKLSDIIKA
jgi:uncharacterized protein (DUF1697 family)